ncbi:MAG: diguanylate cyclase [Alphaproteobacteria bacterium]
MQNLYDVFSEYPNLLASTIGIIGVIFALNYLNKQESAPFGLMYINQGFAALILTIVMKIPEYMDLEFSYLSVFELVFLGATLCLFISGGLSLKGVKVKFYVTLALMVVILLWIFNVVFLSGSYVLMFLTKYLLPTLAYGFLSYSFLTRKTQSRKSGFKAFGFFAMASSIYYFAQILSFISFLHDLWFFMPLMYAGFAFSIMLMANNLIQHQCDVYKNEAEDIKSKLRLIIQSSPFPITISRLKDDQMILVNKSAADLFGINPNNPQSYRMVDFFADQNNRKELLNKLNAHKVVEDFEVLVKGRNTGKPFWLLLSARVIDFEYSVALYCAFQDITNRKNKEKELFDQATRDPLTGAFNRRQFEEIVKKEFARCKRYGGTFCIIMVDADHFKNVNDTYGHQTGDEVLKALSKSFFDTLRETDAVFRFGGEEFVLLLPEITLENAYSVAERLRTIISEIEVLAEDKESIVRFTVSMGIVESTQAEEPNDLVKLSDDALYEAKETGRNKVVISKAVRQEVKPISNSTNPNRDNHAKKELDEIDNIKSDYDFDEELPIDDDFVSDGGGVGKIKLAPKIDMNKIQSEISAKLEKDKDEGEDAEEADSVDVEQVSEENNGIPAPAFNSDSYDELPAEPAFEGESYDAELPSLDEETLLPEYEEQPLDDSLAIPEYGETSSESYEDLPAEEQLVYDELPAEEAVYDEVPLEDVQDYGELPAEGAVYDETHLDDEASYAELPPEQGFEDESYDAELPSLDEETLLPEYEEQPLDDSLAIPEYGEAVPESYEDLPAEEPLAYDELPAEELPVYDELPAEEAVYDEVPLEDVQDYDELPAEGAVYDETSLDEASYAELPPEQGFEDESYDAELPPLDEEALLPEYEEQSLDESLAIPEYGEAVPESYDELPAEEQAYDELPAEDMVYEEAPLEDNQDYGELPAEEAIPELEIEKEVLPDTKELPMKKMTASQPMPSPTIIRKPELSVAPSHSVPPAPTAIKTPQAQGAVSNPPLVKKVVIKKVVKKVVKVIKKPVPKP